jgi:phosphoribosylaminoimidazole-succinocarboxamide synthase
MTGGCEECGLEKSGYYGDDAEHISGLELENHRLKQRIEELPQVANRIATRISNYLATSHSLHIDPGLWRIIVKEEHERQEGTK